jgi:23S rRNA (adenine2030-N6)-methyltransferase
LNYRHAFHAGNHADVLKHVVLLALCDALTAKAAPCFALDTHAGRGLYRLAGTEALRSGEARGGIERVAGGGDSLLARYLAAIAACRHVHGEDAYPGSPWLLAHAFRPQDRIACCELEPREHAALKANFTDDPRVATHARDGYTAMRALLPPRVGEQRFVRGLVLVDPPYEAQLAEFDLAIAALREGLGRWPQAAFALWYPIKRRRDLAAVYRGFADLPARAALRCELLVRPDDSPLRMNGSGLLLLNPPWRLDETLARTLPVLQAALGEAGASCRVDWLRAPA